MTTTDTQPVAEGETPDPARVEQFSGQVVSTYVGATVAFMIDIGHKTGLFEAALRERRRS